MYLPYQAIHHVNAVQCLQATG